MDTDTRIELVEEELRALRETVARLPAEIERQRLALEGREGGDPITESWAHVDRERAATSDAVIAHLTQRAETAERAVTNYQNQAGRFTDSMVELAAERDAAREALRTVRKHVRDVSYYVDPMTSGGRALGLIARAIDAQIDGNTVIIGSDWSPTYPALESKEA